MAESTTMEEQIIVDQSLVPCDICGRTFLPEPLKKHIKVCEKNATKKRKVFDSLKQRVIGTDLEPFHLRTYLNKKLQQVGETGAAAAAPAAYAPPPPQQQQPAVALQSTSTSSVAVARKAPRSKWKERHTELMKAIRAAKGDCPPPAAPAEMSRRGAAPLRGPSMERCPSCDRQFGPKAFDRHVEWCKERQTRIQKSPASVLIAKERLEARTKYRVPPIGKTRRTTTRDKYSPHANRADSVSSVRTESSSNFERSPSTRKPKSVTNVVGNKKKDTSRTSVVETPPKKTSSDSVKIPLAKRNPMSKINTVNVNDDAMGISVAPIKMHQFGESERKLLTWKDTVKIAKSDVIKVVGDEASKLPKTAKSVMKIDVVLKTREDTLGLDDDDGGYRRRDFKDHLKSLESGDTMPISKPPGKIGAFDELALPKRVRKVPAALHLETEEPKNDKKWLRSINEYLKYRKFDKDLDTVSDPESLMSSRVDKRVVKRKTRTTLNQYLVQRGEDYLKSAASSVVDLNGIDRMRESQEDEVFSDDADDRVMLESKVDDEFDRKKETEENELFSDDLGDCGGNDQGMMDIDTFSDTESFLKNIGEESCGYKKKFGNFSEEIKNFESGENSGNETPEIESRENNRNATPEITSGKFLEKSENADFDQEEMSSPEIEDKSQQCESNETKAIEVQSLKSTPEKKWREDKNVCVKEIIFIKNPDKPITFKSMEETHEDFLRTIAKKNSSESLKPKLTLVGNSDDKKSQKHQNYNFKLASSTVSIDNTLTQQSEPSVNSTSIEDTFEIEKCPKNYELQLSNYKTLIEVRTIVEIPSCESKSLVDLRPEKKTIAMKSRIPSLVDLQKNKSRFSSESCVDLRSTVPVVNFNRDLLRKKSESLRTIEGKRKVGCEKKKVENFEDVKSVRSEENDDKVNLRTIEESNQIKSSCMINERKKKVDCFDEMKKNDDIEDLMKSEEDSKGDLKASEECSQIKWSYNLNESEKEVSCCNEKTFPDDFNNEDVDNITTLINKGIEKGDLQTSQESSKTTTEDTSSASPIESGAGDNIPNTNDPILPSGKASSFAKLFVKHEHPPKPKSNLSSKKPKNQFLRIETDSYLDANAIVECDGIAFKYTVSETKGEESPEKTSREDSEVSYGKVEYLVSTETQVSSNVSRGSSYEKFKSNLITESEIVNPEVARPLDVFYTKASDFEMKNSEDSNDVLVINEAVQVDVEEVSRTDSLVDSIDEEELERFCMTYKSEIFQYFQTIYAAFSPNHSEEFLKDRTLSDQLKRLFILHEKHEKQAKEHQKEREQRVKSSSSSEDFRNHSFGGKSVISLLAARTSESTEMDSIQGDNVNLWTDALSSARLKDPLRKCYSEICVLQSPFSNVKLNSTNSFELTTCTDKTDNQNNDKILEMAAEELICDYEGVPPKKRKVEDSNVKVKEEVFVWENSLIENINKIKQMVRTVGNESGYSDRLVTDATLERLEELSAENTSTEFEPPAFTAVKQVVLVGQTDQKSLKFDDVKLPAVEEIWEKSVKLPEIKQSSAGEGRTKNSSKGKKDEDVLVLPKIEGKKGGAKSKSKSESPDQQYNPFITAERQLMELLECDEFKPYTSKATLINRPHTTTKITVDNKPSDNTKKSIKSADSIQKIKTEENNNKRSSVIDPPLAFDDKLADEFELIENFINENFSDRTKVIDVQKNKIDSFFLNQKENDVLNLKSILLNERKYSDDFSSIDPKLINDNDNLSIPEHLKTEEYSPTFSLDTYSSDTTIRNENDSDVYSQQYDAKIATIEPKNENFDKPENDVVKVKRGKAERQNSTVSLTSSVAGVARGAGGGNKKNLSALKRSMTLVDPVPKPKPMRNKEDVDNYFQEQEMRSPTKNGRVSPGKPTVREDISSNPEDLFSVDDELYEEYKKYEEMYLKEKEEKCRNERKNTEASEDDEITGQTRTKISSDSAYGSLNRKTPKVRARSTKLTPLEPHEPDAPGSLSSSSSETSPVPKTPVQRMSTAQRVSKFCHECGSKYPLTSAKFCVECGVKRLLL